MKFLLDTHAFLWFILADARLSTLARGLIANPQHTILVSPVSLWEVAIKISIGKYQIPGTYQTFIRDQILLNRFTVLAIDIDHLSCVASLPYLHRDPFDRLLVSQALVEGMPLISADAILDGYGIQRTW